MSITKISVGISRKVVGPKPNISLQKFETIDYSVGAEATVEPDESPSTVYRDLLLFCKSNLGKELDRIDGIMPKTNIEDDEIPF